MIRGDVTSLQVNGGVSDLGPVVCVEDDSPDPDTVGDEDTGIPAPGQVFFYLFRGTQGLTDGPGTYGFDSGGLERVPSSGDCGGG